MLYFQCVFNTSVGPTAGDNTVVFVSYRVSGFFSQHMLLKPPVLELAVDHFSAPSKIFLFCFCFCTERLRLHVLCVPSSSSSNRCLTLFRKRLDFRQGFGKEKFSNER